MASVPLRSLKLTSGTQSKTNAFIYYFFIRRTENGKWRSSQGQQDEGAASQAPGDELWLCTGHFLVFTILNFTETISQCRWLDSAAAEDKLSSTDSAGKAVQADTGKRHITADYGLSAGHFEARPTTTTTTASAIAITATLSAAKNNPPPAVTHKRSIFPATANAQSTARPPTAYKTTGGPSPLAQPGHIRPGQTTTRDPTSAGLKVVTHNGSKSGALTVAFVPWVFDIHGSNGDHIVPFKMTLVHA